ncbi:tetraacyldisaccharide 4'-kinase [Ramlibacter humi]|uniref:Tetraacyldisaccharide 4'-kinase n=1 Tax=Ramlibacter humi TaxID=2530451 RepID=A0A4Z0C9L0_9BURK|nr:tetraacyldisaccharide 4'-kinase [Ramlibacter humi]TFZ08293.1 tetraacyldisaccharide 4'-kinase [Ramlibacter humi]
MGGALRRAWLRRGPLACLLFPLSLLFGAIAAARRLLYRLDLLHAQRAPVPVIVVGNVIAGGAGKTPVVIALASHLRSRGFNVGVVSRGHGRKTNDVREARPSDDPSWTGDEPLLIARSAGVPVFVGADRPQAIAALLAAHPATQAIVSDDGLQHLAMARDIEIVVFDARGIGNGWQLPAGPLREPWPRHADLVLRTHETPGIEGHEVRRKLAAVARRADGATRPLEAFKGQPCDALAGIAEPSRFFDALQSAGVELRQRWALPDHHDFAAPGPWATHADVPLLCTEKDAVKLWRAFPQAWAVPLEIDIAPAFWQQLDRLLDAKLSSTHGPQAA